MLRIGKPKDSGEAKGPAEKQEGTAKSIDTVTAASGPVQESYYLQSSVASDKEVLALTMSRSEFEQLTAKTTEVLTEAALAQQRIGKDQEEIEQLKKETRAMLAQLRAA